MVMNMNLSWLEPYITVASQIVLTVGLWAMLKKCGNKGWYALIPGFRWYALSDCVGRESSGTGAMIGELTYLMLNVLVLFVPAENPAVVLVLLADLVCRIFMTVYILRIAVGVCQVFNVKRYWSALWLFIPAVMACWFGFNSRMQPIYIDRYNDDGVLAGTRPAQLDEIIASHISEEDAAKPGLHVRLRERSAIAQFKKRYLLKDVHLDIPNGSLVLLLGGSGAGKTTLVNAINGYEKADADIYLNGSNIYENYDQMKYRIGFVPQQDLLRMNDSVNGTLNDAALLRLPADTPKAKRREIVDNVMETLGMGGRTGGLVAKKSGGQKKRISIGMELISDPDLFILDEPDSGLAGVIARELFEKLRQIADSGKIVLAITHTPDRVADLFDKVIVLARDSGRCGRLAFYGSPDEAREFFGRDTMERIVMCVNREEEGGEGRADEFINRYAAMINQRNNEKAEPAETGTAEEKPQGTAAAEKKPAEKTKPEKGNKQSGKNSGKKNKKKKKKNHKKGGSRS